MLRHRLLRSFASLGVALFALHGSAYAQATAWEGASDSIDVLRRARKVQRDFEGTRRANLPLEPDRGSPYCDEHVGRYCYWYEPTDDATLRESDGVKRARERLIRDLAAASTQVPGDGWIIGQLTRYLVEQGLTDSAVIVAQQCQATRWWCGALEGFTRHMARDYESADTVFERALREMPEARRCEWIDLTLLLGEGGRRYRDLPCAERQSVGERIWWLARPLYSRAGNDLRTEHYARHTMALLLEDAATAEGIRWGDDMRELVLRFGWPTQWSRSFDPYSRPEPPAITGHEPSPSFWLLPAPALAEPWADITELHWDPTMRLPPARYAPPYARGFAPIARVQFARFRRSDSTITVAAFDLTGDSVFTTRPSDVRLGVAFDPATTAVSEQPLTKSRGVVTARSVWRPAVLSLEAVGVDFPWVARQRAMAPPDPGGLPPIMSDILLFTPGEILPESLEAALPAALSAAVVPAGEQVGLYWEIYDAPDSTTPIEITVTAAKTNAKEDTPYPVGRPWCPLPPAKAIRLHWREEAEARPRGVGRAVALDLQSLSRGRYLVTIQVSMAGAMRGCSSRELHVTED